MRRRCGAFAGKVQTHEALRMLTLFTYADIQAVHPDALTPWKAENLWRLSMSAANQMDRSVDEERVHACGVARMSGLSACWLMRAGQEAAEVLGVSGRVSGALSDDAVRPEQIRQHFEMAQRFAEEPVADRVSAWRQAMQRDHAGDAGPAESVCRRWRGRWRLGDERRDGGCVRRCGWAWWWTASGLRIRFARWS